MLALIAGGQRAHSEQQRPPDDGEAIASLLGRLRRLLDAEHILAVECDPVAQTAFWVATVGAPGGGAKSLETGAMGLARRLGGAVRASAGRLGVVEIARLRLAAEHGEVLVIEVEVGSASLLIVATRAANAPPFTINEERAARRMGDWIGDYVRLWWRQRRDRQRGDSLHAALDLLDVGVFVLDGHARLHNTNGAARLLLEAGDGLRKVGGMLTAVSLDDASRLRTAIAHASSIDPVSRPGAAQQAPVLSVRRKGLLPLSVAVMRANPAIRAADDGSNLVVIYAVDPQRDIERSLLPICTIFGLTGAETRLAKLLVGGASLTEAAARLQIQAPTARTYLRQVFAKTGTNRQAALVKLLLNSIVRTRPDIELTALQ